MRRLVAFVFFFAAAATAWAGEPAEFRFEVLAATGKPHLVTEGGNKTLGSGDTLAAGDTSTQTARIFAACPGSSGAGELMTTQITFLAVDGG